MAQENRFTGKDLYLSFGGTEIAVLDDTSKSNWRSVTLSENLNLADMTAGSDAHEYQKGTYRAGSGNIELVYESGSGSATFELLKPNQSGTLVIGPRGTVSGRPKYEYEVLMTGYEHPVAFADTLVETYNFTIRQIIAENGSF